MKNSVTLVSGQKSEPVHHLCSSFSRSLVSSLLSFLHLSSPATGLTLHPTPTPRPPSQHLCGGDAENQARPRPRPRGDLVCGARLPTLRLPVLARAAPAGVVGSVGPLCRGAGALLLALAVGDPGCNPFPRFHALHARCFSLGGSVRTICYRRTRTRLA